MDVDKLIAEKTAALLAGDLKAKTPEIIARIKLLQAQLGNVPQRSLRTTLHHVDNGYDVYYYYPRLTIDFSSSVLSPSSLDRFGNLALILRLSDDAIGKGVRIIDFSPKAADIAEYTRGQLTQQYQLQANVSAGPTPVGGAAVPVQGSLSYTQTEQFVRDLKDAIEKRNTGLLDNGTAFYAEFQAIRHLLIGGTYSFDLMLQVPAKIELAKSEKGESTGQYSSEPETDRVTADLMLLGVVRLVHDRGKTGFFVRVPEPENDDVYEQVVASEQRGLEIWKFAGESFVKTEAPQTSQLELTVVTNLEDAKFIVRSESGKVLAQGTGDGKAVSIDASNGGPARVEFLDVIRTPENTSPSIWRAPSAAIEIAPGKRTVSGVYGPK